MATPIDTKRGIDPSRFGERHKVRSTSPYSDSWGGWWRVRWASWTACSVQLARSASWTVCSVQLARSASWTAHLVSWSVSLESSASELSSRVCWEYFRTEMQFLDVDFEITVFDPNTHWKWNYTKFEVLLSHCCWPKTLSQSFKISFVREMIIGSLTSHGKIMIFAEITNIITYFEDD